MNKENKKLIDDNKMFDENITKVNSDPLLLQVNLEIEKNNKEKKNPYV